jgi:hypothetical protein
VTELGSREVKGSEVGTEGGSGVDGRGIGHGWGTPGWGMRRAERLRRPDLRAFLWRSMG